MPFCNNCGTKAPVEGDRCASCGNTIPPDEATVPSQPSLVSLFERGRPLPMDHPLKPMAALLVVRTGPDAGARFVIEEDEVICGRDPGCDVFLEDVTVSRRHARIRRARGSFEMEDAGSLNGTYLNGERVNKGFLTSGDVIQIGKFRLTFFESPAPA